MRLSCMNFGTEAGVLPCELDLSFEQVGRSFSAAHFFKTFLCFLLYIIFYPETANFFLSICDFRSKFSDYAQSPRFSNENSKVSLKLSVFFQNRTVPVPKPQFSSKITPSSQRNSHRNKKKLYHTS